MDNWSILFKFFRICCGSIFLSLEFINTSYFFLHSLCTITTTILVSGLIILRTYMVGIVAILFVGLSVQRLGCMVRTRFKSPFTRCG